MNRFQASAIHLGCSIAVGLVVFLCLYSVWFPGALLTLTGGFSLLKILLSVDIIVGPFITLIIFNQQKKHLKFDLTCIAFLQIVSLAFGLHSMWLSRPVWLAYMHGYFQIVTVPKVIGSPQHAQWAELRFLPAFGPKLIGIRPDDELNGQLDVAMGLASGASMAYFAHAWAPYRLVQSMAIQKGKTFKELEQTQKKLAMELGNHYAKRSVVWLPLKGGDGKGIILIDTQSGKCVDLIKLADDQ